MTKSRNVCQRAGQSALGGRRFDQELQLGQDDPPMPLRDEIGMSDCIRKTMTLMRIATIARDASYEKPSILRTDFRRNDCMILT